MKISPESATHLCNDVIQTFLRWRPLRAALQSGGLEAKCRGQFANAIESWLSETENSELIVLPEYRNEGSIDFALIDPLSVGRPQLSIDMLIEVKFNYASQANGADGGEVGNQLSRGIEQALQYRIDARRPHPPAPVMSDAYVLHLVAAPVADIVHASPRDTGWIYFNQPDLTPAQNRFASLHLNNGWRVLGSAQSGCIPPRKPLLYCVLLGPPLN
jgi:hypothetical protein